MDSEVRSQETLATLLSEFSTSYASTRAGKEHLAAYQRLREVGRANLHAVVAAADAGTDTTDLVLRTLLPHTDSRTHRAQGAWVHVAPAVAGNIQTWFERKGWTRRQDWPAVAAAILDFVRIVNEDPGQLATACTEFSAKPYTRGFQSGMMSPILNAVRESAFSIVNSKKRATLRYLTGVRYRSKLTEYPAANASVRRITAQIAGLGAVPSDVADPDDVFDAFSHWLVAIKKIATNKDRKPKQPGRRRVAPRESSSPAAGLDELYGDLAVRLSVARFLGDSIRAAHRYGPSKWKVTARRARVRLRVGRVLACELVPGEVRLALAWKTLPPDLRARLERQGHQVRESVIGPAVALWGFPADEFSGLEPELRDQFGEALRLGTARVRGVPNPHTHSGELLDYLDSMLGQSLPRPSHAAGGGDRGVEAMPRAVAIAHPRIAFKKVDYDVAGLLSYIDIGDIGLPDIQRPFVWPKAKVRDLFDSMYRGFPVGYLLFWANTATHGARRIGVDQKQRQVPALLIVDGQQRLTSLYAVFRGKPVHDDEFRETRIDIAFRPRDGRFEVADAAIARNPEFIANVSDVFASGKGMWTLVNEFLTRLESRKSVDPSDRDIMGQNIGRLFDLGKYPFTALEISPEVDEEAVSEIFVRINSEGVKLNQGDFILTLLSVFWEDGRAALEQFAREARMPPSRGSQASPFNHFIQPRPDQMLRVSVAVGFHRARMKSVYQLLRGRDVDTAEFSVERREVQFAQLKIAQEHVLDLTHWHLFLGALVGAGFRSGEMVSSENALLYAYALYLLGKLQCNVDERALGRVIGRWFFATTVTGRYTNSPETVMEGDLNRIKDLAQADAFTDALDRIMANTLTNDFWDITLPADLETSSARQPAVFAYYAAQNKLGAPVLFSDKRIADMLDPSLRARKKPLDRHHLFPKRWLRRNGVTDRRVINQVANFALLEWPDNIGVGSAPPREYVPKMRPRFTDAAWDTMCRLHALPDQWETLPYDDFLERRRVLMAAVIRRGFQALGTDRPDGDSKGDIAEGTAEEQPVWRSIAEVERALREMIHRTYEGRWGSAAEQRMRQALGEKAWATIERHRARHPTQYPRTPSSDSLPALDFCYFADLVSLMVWSDAWELFRTPFRDKRELEDLTQSIKTVRNDAAHFRSVPLRELERCRLAIDDLMTLLGRL